MVLIIKDEAIQTRRVKHHQPAWHWRDSTSSKAVRKLRPLANQNFVVASERGYSWGRVSIPGSNLKLRANNQVNSDTIQEFVF